MVRLDNNGMAESFPLTYGKGMRGKIFALFFVCIMVCSAEPVSGRGPLVIASLKGDPFGGEVKYVLRRAYARLNMDVRFEDMPLARSLMESSSGFVDGELCRMEGLEKQYPTLVCVPVPVHRVEMLAVSVKGGIRISDWDSLKGMRVARRNVLVVMRNLPASVEQVVIERYEHGASMLEEGRVDVLVAPRSLVRSLAWLERGFQVHEPPLVSIPLFHYLHRKHEALVPVLGRVLRDMEREGLL